MSLILLSFAVVILLSASVVIHMARTSPEGYEDGTGFHFVGARAVAISATSQRKPGVNMTTLTRHPFALRG